MLLRAAGARLKLQLRVESGDQFRAVLNTDGSAVDGDTTSQPSGNASWDPSAGSLQLVNKPPVNCWPSSGGQDLPERTEVIDGVLPRGDPALPGPVWPGVKVARRALGPLAVLKALQS